MTDRPWWATALQWSLWWIAMIAVMGWLGRARLKPRPVHEAGSLRHPRATLIIGLVTFGFFAALTVLSNLFPNDTATWWTTAIFVGFALMGVPLIIEYVYARHAVSAAGLSYWTYFGGAKFMAWDTLREVRFTHAMRWFRVENSSGDVARLSVMLIGLPDFAAALLEYAPDTTVIDDETLAILQATAAGHPPPAW
ncbi:MAG: hypothetical protein E6Q88_01395 [Lysobacteraceae bacterium]|nr:MAG: hypothetical protein E6Q88_01395 [Xanthomonadaceae bacterium]